MANYTEEVWERQRDPLEIVEAQGQLVPLIVDTVAPVVDRLFRPEAVRAIPRIYLVGCGDSLYAAAAARFAFEQLTQIPTDSVPSLEFSRYLVDHAPRGSLVIAISVSGGVSRTREAAEWAARQGCWVVGLTGRSGSKLAELARDTIVHYTALPRDPGRFSTIGLANFQASLITLHLIAARIGAGLGLLDEAGVLALRQEVRSLAPAMDQAVRDSMEATRAYADRVRDAGALFLLGAGPSYATAVFGAAKLFEGPNMNGVPQELEEWAHEQFFITRQGTEVIIIAPPGRSAERAAEVARSVRAVGARAVIVTSPAEEGLVAHADLLLPIAAQIREVLAPLAYVLPLELLAMHLQALRRSPTAPDSDEDVLRRQVVRQSIKESSLRSR